MERDYEGRYRNMSHPIRVRGLKQESNQLLCEQDQVAPYTGAWIETNPIILTTMSEQVAPYTGAWIETF